MIFKKVLFNDFHSMLLPSHVIYHSTSLISSVLSIFYLSPPLKAHLGIPGNKLQLNYTNSIGEGSFRGFVPKLGHLV